MYIKMCIALFNKIIYNDYNCKKEYPFIDINNQFNKYVEFENELLNNEFNNHMSHNDYIVKRLFIDFCVYKTITKFDLYKECIDGMPFSSKNTKKLFIDKFNKFQKVYFGLIKFREVMKRKLYKPHITFDMKMTEITPTSRNCFIVCQNKKLYYFTITDLLNIFEHNLTAGDAFFVVPQYVKNPYNNIIFDKSTLYNIYFQYKFHTMYINKTMDCFFESDFDLSQLKDNHYCHLLKQYVKHYINNLSESDTVDEIHKMINAINRSFKRKKDCIIICETFPKKLLIEALKDYLICFIQIKYSLTFYEYFQKLSVFKANIVKFIIHNPIYGRNIKRAVSNSRWTNINKPKYCSDYFKFDSNIHSSNEYMTSHYNQKPMSVFHIYENVFTCQNVIYNKILELGPTFCKRNNISRQLFRNTNYFNEYDSDDSDDINDSDDMSIESDNGDGINIILNNPPQTPDGSPPRSRASSWVIGSPPYSPTPSWANEQNVIENSENDEIHETENNEQNTETNTNVHNHTNPS